LKFDKETFVNDYTLNIFTDASLRKGDSPETTSTCAAAIAFVGENIIDRQYRIYMGETSNYGEIKAVRLGVELALAHREYNSINLFSDSQISIYGVRDRVFNWRIINEQLVGYANKIIKNQTEFLDVINLVTDNNLNINFYHQKGHVDTTNIKSLLYARSTFFDSNRPFGSTQTNTDIAFIKYISNCNDMVDHYSRDMLYDISIEKPRVVNPFNFLPRINHQELLNKFNILIGGNN
jgi:ribonuclease HI